MAYELNINANVGGVPQLEQLGAATDKQTERTRRLSEAIAQHISTNDKLLGVTLRHQLEEAKLESLRERHRIQQNALAEAARKRADAEVDANKRIEKSNEQLAASIKNFVTNPLQAAGNAAESFVLRYGAMGVAAVGAGAAIAVGGAAIYRATIELGNYAEQIQNTAIRTGLTTTETQLFSRSAELAGVNAGALTASMRTLSRGLSENSEEGKKAKLALQELGLGADAAFRPMGQLLPEIFQKLANVRSEMERDRIAIDIFGRGGLELLPLVGNLKELERQIKATGIIIDEQGIAKMADYDDKMRLLGMRWEALKNSLAQKAVAVIEFVGGGDINLRALGFRALRQLAPGPGHALEAWDQYRQYQESVEAGASPTGQEVLDRQREQRRLDMRAAFRSESFTALDAYNARSADPAGRIREELKALGPQRDIAEGRVRGATDVPSRQAALDDLARIDARTKALKDQEKATRDLASAEERIIEIRKRAIEGFAKDYFGDSPIGRAFGERAKLGMEEESDIRKVGKNPALRRSIQESYGLMRVGKDLDVQRAIAAWRGKVLDDSLGGDAIGQSAFDSLVKNIRGDDKTDAFSLGNMFTAGRVPPPPGFTSGQEQLRLARDRGSRDLSLLPFQSALGGLSEGSQIDRAHDIRMRQADAEYAATMRIANAKNDEIAKEDALAELKQRYSDADMERQRALLEIAVRQKEAFQNAAVGFVRAARSGNIGGFFQGQLEGLFDKMVGNLAGMAWGRISSMIPHAKQGSFMGGLLQGTIFGADPTKAALVTNTVSNDLNTAATNALTQAILTSGTAGGASAAAGGFSSALSTFSNIRMGGGGGTAASGGGDGEFLSDSPGLYGDSGSDSSAAASSGTSSRLSSATRYGSAGIGAAAGIYGIVTSGSTKGKIASGGATLQSVGSAIPPPAGPIIQGVGMGLQIASWFMGDPVKKRREEIDRLIRDNQYADPVALNAVLTTFGGFADSDRFGGVRGSELGPFPVTEGAFRNDQYGVSVPGRTVSQFGRGGVTVNLTVQAMDSRNILDHHQEIGAAVARAINLGHVELAEALG